MQPWKKGECDKEISRCISCGSGRIAKIYTREDQLHIFRCQDCDLGFVSPRPSQQALSRFYSDSYFEGSSDFHAGTNYCEERAKIANPEQLTGWRALTTAIDVRDKRFLELGCADGAFLKAAKCAKASEVVGIEYSLKLAEFGRRRYGVNIVNGTAERIPFPDASFDIVVAVDLLEHLLDPVKAMNEIARALSVGGLFWGICPNIGAFDFWGSKWIGVQENQEHLSYFSAISLEKLGKDAGLRLVNIAVQGFPLKLACYTHRHPLLRKLLRPDILFSNAFTKARMLGAPPSSHHELVFTFEK